MDTVTRRGHVRSARWERVSRGAYCPRRPAPDWAGALAAWQLVLPAEGGFTHLTAARLSGWATPPLPLGLPVFTAVPGGDRRIRRPGLVSLRVTPPLPLGDAAGLRVTGAAQTLLIAARHLGLLDLTVLLDSALHQAACDPATVSALADQRRRGAPQLRTALRYCDGRAESAWETLLRMFHRVCDVPVEVQFSVPETRFRADLRIAGTRRLVEYDGDVHRTADRHARDLARERQLQSLGWQRFGYTSRVLLYNAAAALRDADAALGRVHDPGRLRRWHQLLAASMFTPAGTAAAMARWSSGPSR